MNNDIPERLIERVCNYFDMPTTTASFITGICYLLEMAERKDIELDDRIEDHKYFMEC